MARHTPPMVSVCIGRAGVRGTRSRAHHDTHARVRCLSLSFNSVNKMLQNIVQLMSVYTIAPNALTVHFCLC